MKEKYTLMTVKEVCKFLKISRRTLFRLIKQGQIPSFKVGRARRFRYGEIVTYHHSLLSVKPRFFRPAVLDKYREHLEEWLIEEDKEGGWIGLRAELTPGRRGNFRYARTRWPTGEKVIRIMPGSFKHLPEPELYHWLKYEIT